MGTLLPQMAQLKEMKDGDLSEGKTRGLNCERVQGEYQVVKKGKTDENLNWLEQKEGHSRERTQGV